MKQPRNIRSISSLLKTISPPTRLAILLVIGDSEACVCHLEAALGKRQAYISQHIMALRQADILRDRREGRFIYYSLSNPSLLDLVQQAARLSGADPSPPPIPSNCECPHCSEERSPSTGDNNLITVI